MMLARLNTARDGHMSPIERAMVLGIAMSIIFILDYLFGEGKGPEQVRIWEIPLFAGVFIALGLMSSLSWWWRVPLYTLLATANRIGVGLVLSRPNDLYAGVIVSSLLGAAIGGVAISSVDLPSSWRRWSSSATNRVSSLASWLVYYGVTSIVWIFLFASIDVLCDALVSTVLPSPKIMKQGPEIEASIAMFLFATAILLIGRKSLGSSRALRVWQPAMLGIFVAVLWVAIIEMAMFVLVKNNAPLPSWADQAFITERVTIWSTGPLDALRGLFLSLVLWSIVFIPIAIALAALWDRARAQGRRSRALSVLVPALLLVMSSIICGVLADFIATATDASSALSLYRRIGSGSGLVIGGLLSWFWLRWTASPIVSEESHGPQFVSGTAELPEHVAKAVQASRNAML